MADLKIPSLNNKSDKYIFKKKLNLRRKSKKRLFTESFFLFIFSVLLVYVNYLIPNKKLLLQNLPTTINKSFLLFIDFFSYLYEIFLVIFIFASYFTALIFMVGSFYRLFRVSKRKSKQISYKKLK
jgi:type II secretory pathway component PulF